jgi:ABC-type transport system involved in multi-copper enzyme maturation permease subunit
MSNKPKRDNNRYSRARARYTTINAVGLAIIGAAVAYFFTSPTVIAIVGASIFATFVIGAVYLASLRLYQIEREQVAEDSEENAQMLKEAIKEGMQEALRDTIAQAIRAELARTNLEDSTTDVILPEDDADNDTLQDQS